MIITCNKKVAGRKNDSLDDYFFFSPGDKAFVVRVESIYDVTYRLTSYKLILLFNEYEYINNTIKNNLVVLDCRKYDDCDVIISNLGMSNRYKTNQYVSWKDTFVEDENIVFNFV